MLGKSSLLRPSGSGSGSGSEAVHPASPQPLTNRCADHPSLYIRSQAESPIAWQLLDDVALHRAKTENKLIFLNIGYHACHYSQLMTHDAFQHPDCAAMLNTNFVPVIVDREERSDIDAIYLTYVEAVHQVGGWPLNIFLAPNLDPVFGGTFWPSPDSHRAGVSGSVNSGGSNSGNNNSSNNNPVSSGGSGINRQNSSLHDDAGEEAEVSDFLSILTMLNKFWVENPSRCRAEARMSVEFLERYAAEGVLDPELKLDSTLMAAGAGSSRFSATTIHHGFHASRPADAFSSSAILDDVDEEEAASDFNTRNATLPSTESSVAPPVGDEVNLGELDLELLEQAYNRYSHTYDVTNEGFGPGGAKYVTPAKLSFLLQLPHLPEPVQDIVGEGECKTAVYMATETLHKIATSSLRDHIGRGFHRCAITPDWSLPHFEKVMPENALLLGLYTDAWLSQRQLQNQPQQRSSALNKNHDFLEVVVELADYLSQEPIALPGGGFFSSEAADSRTSHNSDQLGQGAYYLWTSREFESILGTSREAKMAETWWNVQPHGNVPREYDPVDEFMIANVLHVKQPNQEVLARQYSTTVEAVQVALKDAKQKLAQYCRKERIRPDIDDKVVAGWNGIALGALARAGSALKAASIHDAAYDSYIQTAERTAHFLRSALWDADTKKLYRMYSNGQRSSTLAFADDYAYLIEGLLHLYHATGKNEWLSWAKELQDVQIDLFLDLSIGGGFFTTTADEPHAILRLKSGVDASLPSANAVSVRNLFTLAAHFDTSTADTTTVSKNYSTVASRTVAAFEPEMLHFPWILPGLLVGVATSRLGAEVTVLRPGQEEADVVREFALKPSAGVRTLIRLETEESTLPEFVRKALAEKQDVVHLSGVGAYLDSD